MTDRYRQSLLASFETCPLRCKADLDLRAATGLEINDDGGFATGNVGTSGDLGTVLHAVAAEMMRTLRRTHEPQMPTEEAIVIMREVYAKTGIVLPAEDRESLRYLTLKLCAYAFDPDAFIAIERRLEATIRCPDGVERTLTGTPDLLLRQGGGITVIDYKTGWAIPRKPRKPPPEGEPIQGKRYLSDRGHFQLDSYGLLALLNFKGAHFASLRELHLRSGEIREADLERDELEHVEYELGAQMQKLAEAKAHPDDERLWQPKPGRHCLRQCPIVRSCPIPVRQRGDGALASEAEADTMAEEYVVVQGLRDHLRGTLKAWHEETGHCPDVGDGNVMRWKDRDDRPGSRTFDIHPPADPDEERKAAAP